MRFQTDDAPPRGRRAATPPRPADHGHRLTPAVDQGGGQRPVVRVDPDVVLAPSRSGLIVALVAGNDDRLGAGVWVVAEGEELRREHPGAFGGVGAVAARSR